MQDDVIFFAGKGSQHHGAETPETGGSLEPGNGSDLFGVPCVENSGGGWDCWRRLRITILGAQSL